MVSNGILWHYSFTIAIIVLAYLRPFVGKVKMRITLYKGLFSPAVYHPPTACGVRQWRIRLKKSYSRTRLMHYQ